jgi:hypothetical protein
VLETELFMHEAELAAVVLGPILLFVLSVVVWVKEIYHCLAA